MPEKLSVILDNPMYEVLRNVAFNERTKREGEQIRRILARDPAMKEQAEKMGINLDEMITKQVGGYRGK